MSIKGMFIICMFGLVAWSGVTGAKSASEVFQYYINNSPPVEILVATNQ